MSKRAKDMTGQRYGTLTVIRYSKRKTKWGGTYWVCRCECGRHLYVRGDNLRDGRTSKCSDCKTTGGIPSVFCEVDAE